MRSPFSLRSSFTNGPNKAERSVWIGGTTLARIDKEKDVGESSEKNEEEEEAESRQTNPSSSVGGSFRSEDKDDQQRVKKPSLIQRIKSLSPRREADSNNNDDTNEVFFSPDSIPPVPAASASAPKDRKIHSSQSVCGDEVINKSTSNSSNSSSNRPKRRHVTSRRKRSSSNSSRKSQLFRSSVKLDAPSCAIDEGEEIHRRGGGSSDVDLEAALIPRDGDNIYGYDDDSIDLNSTTAPSIGSKRKQHKEKQRSVSIIEDATLSKQRQQLQATHMNGVKRRRLSKRARTRLTMREVNSNIQPGRNDSVLEDSMGALEKRRAITLPKTIDFFLRIEIKLIAVNALVSVLLTLLVLTTFPESWKIRLKESSLSVSLLGAFLSFALVFRTQSCYQRWWEARTQWGKMTATCINVAGQALTWFEDEELIDRFLTHCIIFPYACKACLRGNALTSSSEEGPRFLQSGLLTDADLGVIVRHGT